MRRPLFAIAALILTVLCASCQASVIEPSAVTSMPIVPTSPPGTPGCRVIVDGQFPVPTPLPSQGTPFTSIPDPQTGAIFTGTITFTLSHFGILGSYYGVTIMNTSEIPLPVSINDLHADLPAISSPRPAPTWYVFQPVQISRVGNMIATWKDFVPPHSTITNEFIITGGRGDFRQTGIAWTIAGSLNTITVPYTEPSAPTGKGTLPPGYC